MIFVAGIFQHVVLLGFTKFVNSGEKKEAMKNTLLLVSAAIFLAMLVTPSFAETTALRMRGKAAVVELTDGVSYAMIAVSEMMNPTKMTILQFMLQDPSNGFHIFEQKELDRNEFCLSSGVCRLSTEIAGSTLLLEWKTIVPPQFYHTNERFELWWPLQGTVHLVSVSIVKVVEARLSWNGYTVRGGGQVVSMNLLCVIQGPYELSPSPP